MKILAIGNIFESKSLLVNSFCNKDDEVSAKNVFSRISGATTVVAAVAAYLHIDSSIYTKAFDSQTIRNFMKKLSSAGVDITLIDRVSDEENLLITIYNNSHERKCYSYLPNQIVSRDLLKYDFSIFDVVFFCCLPFEQIYPVFINNNSIRLTKSVILASGLSKQYFSKYSLKINPNYIFINRGELCKIFNSNWNNSMHEINYYLDEIKVDDSVLIVTMGSDGVLIKDNDKKQNVSVKKIDKIIHPGGAGDSFATGFIKGILNGKAYNECCDIGHLCAEKMLSVKNVEEFIDNFLLARDKYEYN